MNLHTNGVHESPAVGPEIRVAIVTGFHTCSSRNESLMLTSLMTGGADGFGAAIVDRFSTEGFQVIFIDLSQEKGEDKARSNEHLHFISGDVTLKETWEQALRVGEEMFGRVDVVVNNAGKSICKS